MKQTTSSPKKNPTGKHRSVTESKTLCKLEMDMLKGFLHYSFRDVAYHKKQKLFKAKIIYKMDATAFTLLSGAINKFMNS